MIGKKKKRKGEIGAAPLLAAQVCIVQTMNEAGVLWSEARKGLTPRMEKKDGKRKEKGNERERERG